jgi:hypothetical protein
MLAIAFTSAEVIGVAMILFLFTLIIIKLGER